MSVEPSVEAPVPVKAGRVSLPPMSEAVRALIPLFVAIIGLGIFGALASDEFLTVTNTQNVFQQLAVLGVLCVGQMLLMIAGQLDLSVGSAVAMLGVIGAKLLDADPVSGVAAGSSETVVVVVCLAGGAAIGLIIGLLVAFTRVQPFILTLGGLSVFGGLALIISGQEPVPVGTAFTDLSLGRWGPIPVPAAIFAALCVVGALLLRFTPLGRFAFATGSNEEAAFLAGVPVATTKVVLYVLNGLLVGVAAVLLLGRIGAGDPNGGVGLELQVVTAVILGGAALTGGRGSMLGAFLGAFVLGLIGNTLNLAGVPNAWERVVFGGVLILAVLWVALGDLSRKSDLPLHRQLGLALTRWRR